MNDLLGISTCVCPVCGKKFERLSIEWRYQITKKCKTYYYCRYSCWCKALKDFEVKPDRKKSSRLSEEQKQQLNKLLDEGVDVNEIIRLMNVTKPLLYYYQKKRS